MLMVLLCLNQVQEVIVFTTWHVLSRCVGATEAEAMACLESIRFAVQWVPGSVILESDCARLVNTLRGSSDRSELGFIVAEIRQSFWVMHLRAFYT
jgi:hypothetical protein